MINDSYYRFACEDNDESKPEKEIAIIEIQLEGFLNSEGVTNYKKVMDLKGFWNELSEMFVSKSFKDMIGTPEEYKEGKFFDCQKKLGELAEEKDIKAGERNPTRTGTMWEKKFVLRRKLDGTQELELKWLARKKMLENPDNAWLECEVDVICRMFKDEEVVVNDSKKILQSSILPWELRNRYKYRNNIIEKYLKKIPLVKDSRTLKKMYLDNFHRKNIERDIRMCKERFIPLIEKLVKKHFGSGQ